MQETKYYLFGQTLMYDKEQSVLKMKVWKYFVRILEGMKSGYSTQ